MNLFDLTILDFIDQPVILFDKYGEIEFVNKTAKINFGLDEPGLIDVVLKENKKKISVIRRAYQMINTNEMAKSFAFETNIKNYGNKEYIIRWKVLKTNGDKLIAFGQDITDLVRLQKSLEERQREIIESIEYAKELQTAILPDNDLFEKYFQEYFIYFKPKDILSGDFYWIHESKESLFVAMVDCTGHGVPGSLMTVLANGILREVIVRRGIEDPVEILRQIDDELVYALSKKRFNKVYKDGMDLALLKLNKTSPKLDFAGAGRPIVKVDIEGNLYEFKSSRLSLGYYYGIEKNFNSQTVDIEKGDTIYLFSDGYCDQFGGQSDKKFTKAKFKELLKSMAGMPLDEQQKYLDYVFNNWKQSTFQTDDVLVIGLKF